MRKKRTRSLSKKKRKLKRKRDHQKLKSNRRQKMTWRRKLTTKWSKLKMMLRKLINRTQTRNLCLIWDKQMCQSKIHRRLTLKKNSRFCQNPYQSQKPRERINLKIKRLRRKIRKLLPKPKLQPKNARMKESWKRRKSKDPVLKMNTSPITSWENWSPDLLFSKDRCSKNRPKENLHTMMLSKNQF